MCGIAGIVGKPATPEREGATLTALGHRGPDARGTWQNGIVHLMHTRLKIIDLSDNAAQPMRDPVSGVTIVFNGEIYNFQDLRAELGADTFFSRSDTETVLRAYLRHGIACLDRLRGMFAIAIWDPRSGQLHLARDRFGIKPLYVWASGGELIFGSEIKALLTLGAPSALNRSTVADYLLTGRVCHGEDTFFEGVRAIPAGTVLSFRDGQTRTSCYWSAFTERFEGENGDDADEVAWELLKESMRLHLVSDVPVGVSLSAGLDSQLIAHLLAAVGAPEMHCFTFGFDDETYDEIPDAERIATLLSLTSHTLRMRPEQVLEKLETAIEIFETPLGGLGTLSAYCLMALAREQGVPVLLSGEGSDEIFGGYRYYYRAYFRDLAEAGETALLEQELAAFARTNGEHIDPMDLLDRQATTPGVYAPDGSTLGGLAFLGPDLEDLDRPYEYMSQPPPPLNGHSRLRSAMLSDLTSVKLPKLLWFQDRASMAWGVETRVPFLDHKHVEFISGLPANWLIRDGVSKFLPRRLLERCCGVGTADMVKRYVATPQREWLKGPLFNAVNRFIENGALATSGLVDTTAFLRAYRDYADSPELGNSFFVWKMINLEAFLRRFFPAGR